MGYIRRAVKDSSTKKSQIGLEGKQSSEGLRGILTFWLSHRYEMFFLDQDATNDYCGIWYGKHGSAKVT